MRAKPMNAINFIKDHGVEKAKEVVSGAPEWVYLFYIPTGEYCFICIEPTEKDDFVSILELKRLIESVDRINLVGLDQAKHWIKKANSSLAAKRLSNSKSEVQRKVERTEQDIKNFEAIFSNDIKIEVSFGISLMPPERLACIDLMPRPVIDCETLDHPEDYTSPNCKRINLEQENNND